MGLLSKTVLASLVVTTPALNILSAYDHIRAWVVIRCDIEERFIGVGFLTNINQYNFVFDSLEIIKVM